VQPRTSTRYSSRIYANFATPMRRSLPRGALSRGVNGLSLRRRGLCTPAAQAAWARVQREAAEMEAKCPTFGLRSLVQGRVLRHETLSEGLSIELSQKLTANGNTYVDYEGAMKHALSENPQIADAAAADMEAFMRVDPAAEGFLGVYLFYKGFQALQCARVANYFWRRPDRGGRMFARLLQSEMSDVFGLGESSHPFHMPDAVLSPYATRRVVPMCRLGSFPWLIPRRYSPGCAIWARDHHRPWDWPRGRRDGAFFSVFFLRFSLSLTQCLPIRHTPILPIYISPGIIRKGDPWRACLHDA